MASNFPGTGIDSFTNPSSGNFLNSPSHSLQHANANDAIVAIENKVGVNGSAVTTSLDYKLGGVTGSDKAASKTGSETLTNKTLTTPIISSILNSGTLTLPTASDTLVGRATTDTLTNKTLTSPKVGTSILDTNGALLITVSATASAVNGISIVNSATGVDPQILPGGTDSTRNLNLRGKGAGKTVTIGAGGLAIFPFDFVASGCLVTADNAGVNKNYSMSSGVIVIAGNPVTIASVSAQTVGASKDRYIDYSDNGDGTGLITTTEVSNNAASPALAAGSVRVAIVVAGATTIANAASINQGQETSVLPIASSIAYSVTDSLGNLINPRDPQRRTLGYRQITNTVAVTSTSFVVVAGLSCPVIIPTGRRVYITVYSNSLFSTTSGTPIGGIFETNASGAQLAQWNGIPSTTLATGMNMAALTTPSASSKSYVAVIASASSGTASLGAGAALPAFIKVDI